ncbi:terminase [Mesorhizobium sp. M4B.F.Ca.ET.215.01.1.1]|uniref:terminase family protein n=1 Tax=unclassified Mesorhizobium TaxID=325217 RepID=UPI0010933ADA|nr:MULTISPECIES: terminase family protein [unclassified Mesorhizobium]TGQ11215.1 terminase [Mesorhizobium sp. M4B.F.Ca.ET.215.01.1.1]TGR04732.1 terminase [Mesorhizobium sp. M4B.F.Ca.ET.203.01.1.1]
MTQPVDLRQIEALIAKLSGKQKDSLKSLVAPKLAMAFKPNPGPQTDAYYSDADELFYGGAAGGGKSALICGLAINEFSHSHIFRREATQLRGIVEELRRIVGSSDGFNGQDKIWKLPDGKMIELAGVKDEADKEKWQGRAAPLKAFDEITQFSESQFRYIIGWNRSAGGERCRVIATGNPPTTSDGYWVTKYWGAWLDPTHPNPAKPGELRWYTTIKGEDVECDGPDQIEVDGKPVKPRSRTFIPSRLEDNPDLMETDYASVLEAMPEELRIRLREGRFDAAIKDTAFQVIPTEWIRAAQARWTPEPPKGVGMSVLSHDVALGGGDANAYARRHGHWYDEIVSEKLKGLVDPIDLAARDLSLMRDGCPIVIDMGGGYGSGVYSHLKNNVQSLTLYGHNGSSESKKRARDGKLKFTNKRAEVWWLFREALEPNLGEPIALPPDPELLADLAAPTWKLGKNGILIEAKEDIKKRLGRSPDKGDCVVNAWGYGESSVSARIRTHSNANGRRPTVVLGHSNMKKRRA